jgi:uncharacterized protein (TIGR03083 family)
MARLSMPNNAKTWDMIHTERRAMADTLDGVAPEQWSRPSLCAGWTIKMAAAHVLAGAEQTPTHFLTHIAGAGFRFNTMIDRDIHARDSLEPGQIIERLRLRTTTTNRPPAPVATMLGEIVVHGEDIRRPMGLEHAVDPEAAVACLAMYVGASFPVGGKKRIRGLRLVATDADWSFGTGPEVTGQAMTLLLAMTGRAAGVDGLSGEGAKVFGDRVMATAS